MYGVNFENPWVLGVDRAGKRVPAWAAALGSSVFAALILFTVQLTGPTFYTLFTGAAQGAPKGWDVALALDALQVMAFAPFIVVAAAGMKIEGRRVRGAPGGGALWSLVGLIVGLAGFGLSVALAWGLGAVEPGAEAALAPIAVSLVLGLVIVGFQALAEEVFFRAWLQPLLSVQWGPWVGLVVTSILFAGLHNILQRPGFLANINLFLGGMLFGLLALRSGGLAAPAAAHFAWNWTEAGGLGLDPPPTGGLISLHLKGPSLWSGGVDTMNGSLATTLVLLALVFGLIVARRFVPKASGG